MSDIVTPSPHLHYRPPLIPSPPRQRHQLKRTSSDDFRTVSHGIVTAAGLAVWRRGNKKRSISNGTAGTNGTTTNTTTTAATVTTTSKGRSSSGLSGLQARSTARSGLVKSSVGMGRESTPARRRKVKMGKKPSIGTQSTPRASILSSRKAISDLANSSGTTTSSLSLLISSMDLDTDTDGESALSSRSTMTSGINGSGNRWEAFSIVGRDAFGLTIWVNADGTTSAISPSNKPGDSRYRSRYHHGTLDFDSDAEPPMGYDEMVELFPDIELGMETEMEVARSISIPIHEVESPTWERDIELEPNQWPAQISEADANPRGFDDADQGDSHPTRRQATRFVDLTVPLNDSTSGPATPRPRLSSRNKWQDPLDSAVSAGSTPHPASKGRKRGTTATRWEADSATLDEGEEVLSAEQSRRPATRSQRSVATLDEQEHSPAGMTIPGDYLPSPSPLVPDHSAEHDPKAQAAFVLDHDEWNHQNLPFEADAVVAADLPSSSPPGDVVDFDLEEVDHVTDISPRAFSPDSRGSNNSATRDNLGISPLPSRTIRIEDPDDPFGFMRVERALRREYSLRTSIGGQLSDRKKDCDQALLADFVNFRDTCNATKTFTSDHLLSYTVAQQINRYKYETPQLTRGK